MALIKVEDYLDGAVDIQDTDLIDLTVDLGGGNFRSDKLPFAVLKLVLLGVRRFKVTRDFEDFSIAATINTLLIFQIPAGYVLESKTTKHSIKWDGGGAGAIESKEGVTLELDRYSPGGPFDIFQAVSDAEFDHNTLNFLENWGVVTDVRGTIEADVDLDTLDQGEIEYFFYIKQIK